VRLIGLLVLCAVGAWTRDKRIQLGLAAGYFLYYLSWVLRLYRVLE